MTTQVEKIPVRVILHNRDVQNITGLKERGARYLLKRIRDAYNKTPNEYITIDEFCAFTGIAEDLVKKFLTY